jgi:hypothetical protein
MITSIRVFLDILYAFYIPLRATYPTTFILRGLIHKNYKDETVSYDLKTQSVPRSKHSLPRL